MQGMRKKIVIVLLILIQLAVAITFIYTVCTVKFFKVTESNGLMFLICIILAIVFSCGTWLFLLRRTVKAVHILLMGSVCICSFFCCGSFILGGSIQSVTYDISNYGNYDAYVEKQTQRETFLLPDEIPEQAISVRYHYSYTQTLDDEVEIKLLYFYEDVETLKAEKEQIKLKYKILSEQEVEGIQFYYTAMADRVIFVAFNEKEKSIFYGYYEHMGVKEIIDYYEEMLEMS